MPNTSNSVLLLTGKLSVQWCSGNKTKIQICSFKKKNFSLCFADWIISVDLSSLAFFFNSFYYSAENLLPYILGVFTFISWTMVIITALKSLSDYYNAWAISVLWSVDCLLPWELVILLAFLYVAFWLYNEYIEFYVLRL